LSVEIEILAITAASIGFVHTLLGPDHYIPFIMLARASNWSKTKTAVVTILSGFGHVLSSVVIGLIGILFGVAIHNLTLVESFRGNIAGWMMIIFGLLYFLWGVKHSLRLKQYSREQDQGRDQEQEFTRQSGFTSTGRHEQDQEHEHDQEDVLNHNLSLCKSHNHLHSSKAGRVRLWTLFAIFIFGPCEPLIPILMYPAAKESWFGVAIVTLIFGVVTISTMLAIVILTLNGIKLISPKKVEKHMHAIAGAMILMCGLTVQFLGV
jgi:sulfite exporter TauE/SafE